MTDKEKSLIDQAKHGSKEAFAQLYNRYYRLIRYIIYDAVKDDDLTADLLSTTFVKAYERLNYFVESISFEAWLKTIAINTVIDYVRARNRKQSSYSLDDENSNVQVADTIDDPEKVIIKAESIELLKKALQMLRSKYRSLITLKYYENMSYEDISATLGIPVGTVKSDLHKARQKLKYFYQKLSNSN